MYRLALIALPACGLFTPPAATPTAPPDAATPTDAAIPTDAANGATFCNSDVHVFPTWQGEYPGPIVSVKQTVDVPSYKGPCDVTPAGTCRLPVGVAHPWASPGIADKFATVRAIERFTSTVDQEISDADPPTRVRGGERVDVLGYLGENFCTLQVGGREVTARCPDDTFTALPGATFAERSLFHVQACGAWVLADTSLLDRAEVDEGNLVEYGRVAP